MLLWLFLTHLFYLCETKKITIITDSNDDVTAPIIETLNISLIFYKSLHVIREKIQLEVLHQNSNSALSDGQLSKSNFAISLARDDTMKRQIMGISEKLNLATIQTHLLSWDGFTKDDISQSETEQYIEMVPSYMVFNNILSDLISRLGITNEITVIYDEKYQSSMEYDWHMPFQKLNVSVNFEYAESSSQLIRAHLNRLTLITKVLLFITDTSVIENYVINSESEIKSKLWTWIVVTRDLSPFKCLRCLDAQIYWVSLTKTTRNEVISKLSEFIWPRKMEKQFLSARTTRNQLRTSYCLDVMFLALDYLIGLDITRENLAYQVGVHRQHVNMTLARLIENRTGFDFGEFVHHGGNLYYQSTRAIIIRIDRMSRFDNSWISKYIANWTLENGIHSFYPDKLHVNVRQLTHYRIVTILQEPYVQNDGPSETFGFRGYCIDLLKILQKELNFTYELYLVPDKKFGRLDQTGIWSGMISELVSGQADIALGPISVTNERDVDVDFTRNYYYPVGTTILMRKKKPDYSLFKFVMVLEPKVWLCIFGCYLFISTLLWIFDRFSPYSYTNQRERHRNGDNVNEFSLFESLWFCVNSFTLQGGTSPRNISGRLVAAAWWLFGFIAIASYTANLAVFLAVSRVEQQIGSLDDLANQYKIKYAPLKDGSTETYFRRMEKVEKKFYEVWKQITFNDSMTNEEIKRENVDVWDYPASDKFTNVWRFMKQSEFPRTVEEAIQRVKTSKEGFAFIGDSTDISYASLVDCSVQQIGLEFSYKSYAIALQNGSRLGSEMSPIISKLTDDRTLEKMKRKWWHENPKRMECPSETDQTGISIHNIGGVFILILVGIILSLTILVVESVQQERNLKKQTKNTVQK